MSLEQLQTAIVTQGASLPDLAIDIEDSDGELADLSAYTGENAKVIDSGGNVVITTATCAGIATGFLVSFTDDQVAALPAGEYLVQAEGVTGGRTRMGKCRLEVVTGY